MWSKDNLIRELDQIDPENLPVSPPAPPSQLQIARAELADARSDIEELRTALSRLEVAANTVVYCYRNRPGNFAIALKALEDDAATARDVIDATCAATSGVKS